jgi:Protein of unknown function (DUF3102)
MPDNFDYSILMVDADALRQTAERVRTLVTKLTPAALDIGNLLTDAKRRIPHGLFGAWCLEALAMDRRLAEQYMALAKAAEKYGRPVIEKLPLTAAHAIAARSTPTEVVTDVLNRVAAGNIPTAAVVKNMIRDSRSSKAPASGDDPGPERKVEILSGVLMETLDAANLAQLAEFLSSASQNEIRTLGRNLEASSALNPTWNLATTFSSSAS